MAGTIRAGIDGEGPGVSDIRHRTRLRPIAWLAMIGILAGSCSSAEPTTTTTTEAPTTTTLGIPDTAESDRAMVPGVDPDAMTITLGVLADLAGPFASLSVDVVDAFGVYWDLVNDAGGIDGWGVDLRIANTRGDPTIQAAEFEAMSEDIFALGQATGSEANAALLDRYAEEEVLVVPLSWYSGWPFTAVDGGVVLEQYTNYCLEAMNAVDFVAEMGGTSIAIVTDADLYGRDAAAGAAAAAAFYGLTVAYDGGGTLEAGGDLGPVLRSIAESAADWTFLATSPAVSPQVLAGAVQLGYEGEFIGTAPSYDARLLDAASGELFSTRYHQSAYAVAWGDESPGNQAMMAALATAFPDRRPSDAFIIGWNAAVTMREVLAATIASGDLTRRGAVAAANRLSEVDFGGSAPNQRYAGQPNEFVTRSTAIYRPDLDTYVAAGGFDQRIDQPGATTGSLLVRPFTEGPAAAGYAFDAPCVTLE